MKLKTLFSTLLAMGIATSASALEYDFEANPDGIANYASVIQVPLKDDEGNDVVDGDGAVVTEPALSFVGGARARTASHVGDVIAAYGGSFDFENNADGVFHFASVGSTGVVDDEGNPVMDADGNQEMEPSLSFAGGHRAWRATTIHNVLTAYGLEFDFETVNSVLGYASVRTEDVVNEDDQEETVYHLDLTSNAVLLESSKLHSILSAYK